MFDKCFEKLIALEGGYVNDPNDSGGETNYGISKRSYPSEDIKAMTLDRAKQIYKKDYWDKMKLTEICAYSSDIAKMLFDFGVNAGTLQAVTFLQRSLNALNCGGTHFKDIDEDGIVGLKTLTSLGAYFAKRGDNGKEVIFKCVNAQIGNFYIEICRKNSNLEKFFFGWISRRVL